MDEALAAALSEPRWIEFKPLFLEVYAALQRRGAASAGEEALRLGTYEKLHTLVRAGSVEKNGKSYRGNREALTSALTRVATDHCRNLLSAVRRAERGGARGSRNTQQSS
jgi:hypothetical protein